MDFDKLRKNKKIILKYHTLWTKSEMKVLAFFAKNNNRPSTYREIARAYVSSSYSHFRKACESLLARSWLIKLENGSYQVYKSNWKDVERGSEFIEFRFPYYDKLKKLVKRVK